MNTYIYIERERDFYIHIDIVNYHGNARNPSYTPLQSFLHQKMVSGLTALQFFSESLRSALLFLGETGIIKLPIWVNQTMQMQVYECFEGFPLNRALFGLVIFSDPCEIIK